MSAEQIARLDALGLIWNVLDAGWEEGFQHLQAFVKEKGHCEVPNRYVCADGNRLGVWVQNVRARPQRMSAEQIARLDALRFIWQSDLQGALWESKFDELKHYKERFGDCNVPIKWNENLQLGGWVSKQRQKQRAGKLSAERKERLDALGFSWLTPPRMPITKRGAKIVGG